MAKQQDSEGIAKVMAARAARLGTPVFQKSTTGPGAIWNTAGLQGHPGNQPMNVWGLSGLPYSPFNGQANGQDWRTVVVAHIAKKNKENNGG